MRVVPLALRREPADVLAALAATEPGAMLCTVPDPDRPVTLVGCAPIAELRLDGSEDDPFGAIERFVAAAPVVDPSLPFPMAGGVVGYLAYELGRTAARATRLPAAVLRRYDPLLVLDHAHARWSLVGSAPAPWLERLAGASPHWTGPLATAPLAAAFDPAAYARRGRTHSRVARRRRRAIR